MISLKIFSGICSTDKVEAAVSLEVVLAEAEDSEAASAAISGETSAAAAEEVMEGALADTVPRRERI